MQENITQKNSMKSNNINNSFEIGNESFYNTFQHLQEGGMLDYEFILNYF